MTGQPHHHEHQGPSGSSSASIERLNEANVLVTGFGSLETSNGPSSSSAIARSLPSVFPATPAHPTRVRIVHHEDPIGTSYAKVDEFMQKIQDLRTRYDLVLHIGDLPGYSNHEFYTLETTAFRGRYNNPDNTQMLPSDQTQPLFWGTSPAGLKTTARVQDVFNRWASDAPENIQLRVSEDAGKFLSEYLYYSTLAYYNHMRNNDLPWYERTTVALIRVPPATDSESIDRGRLAVTSLIYSLVDSRRMRDGDHEEELNEGIIMVDESPGRTLAN